MTQKWNQKGGKWAVPKVVASLVVIQATEKTAAPELPENIVEAPTGQQSTTKESCGPR